MLKEHAHHDDQQELAEGCIQNDDPPWDTGGGGELLGLGWQHMIYQSRHDQ